MSPSDWMASMQQRIGRVRHELKDRRKSEPITFQGLRRPDRSLFYFLFSECIYILKDRSRSKPIMFHGLRRPDRWLLLFFSRN
jgi:hypothetical protein